jgi:hypothetical protein
MESLIKRELIADQALLTLRKEAGVLTRRADWEKAVEIEGRYQKKRRKTERIFHRDYDKRFEMAARHLAKVFGKDWAKLQRQKDPRTVRLVRHISARSKLDVEHDHRRRLTVLKEREAGELGDLIQSARDRENSPQPSVLPKRITDQCDDRHRLGPNRGQ